MEFEFDPAKNQANKAKHGIDFEEAKALWDAETITVEQLDRLVDEGKEDVLQYFDLDNARRGGAGTKRINIDLPSDFLTQLDREATRRGIARQSLIKVWLYDRLHSSGQEAQSIVDLFGALAKTQSIKKVGRLKKRATSRPKN